MLYICFHSIVLVPISSFDYMEHGQKGITATDFTWPTELKDLERGVSAIFTYYYKRISGRNPFLYPELGFSDKRASTQVMKHFRYALEM